MDLLSLLSRYLPIDSRDASQAEKIKTFINASPACFERTHLEGHIIGSAWLVDPSGDNVLLTHHKKLGLWVQLGGHADGDSNIRAVALREAKEESGIEDISILSNEIFDVDIHAIPERKNEPAHFHYDIRFLFRANQTNFVCGDESHQLAWVNIGKLNEFTKEESLLRMAEKWRRWKK